MAITIISEAGASESSFHESSKKKILFITGLFLFSLLTFVTQTEFTSQAYQLGFSEPLILLLVTHGSWWLLWPLQAFVVSLWKTFQKFQQQPKPRKMPGSVSHNISSEIQYQRLNTNSASQLLEENEFENTSNATIPILKVNYWTYFKKCVVKQFHNVYHTSILIYEANVNGDTSTNHHNVLIDQNPHISSTSSITSCIKTFVAAPSVRYIIHKTFLITLVLTIAGGTWYGSMAMTYASDVTAIYNCSAFTAYAFAIPILKERFSWLKATSVVVAVSGVFIVAYSDDSQEEKRDDDPYPYRFWGNLLILGGAVLYGYYEVLYKRYVCIPPHLAKLITPRRQSTFANFVMALLGGFTCLILLSIVIIVQVFHIHDFKIFSYGENTKIIWLYVFGSMVSNLLFSASFLSLMALTSPVLSSVSSLLTIFLIGLVEWWFLGNTLSFQQLLGDFFVIVGFVILTAASWKDISEGNEADDVENVSTYSFALSYDGNTNEGQR